MRKFYTKKIFFIIVSIFWIDKIQFFMKIVTDCQPERTGPPAQEDIIVLPIYKHLI